MAANEGAVLAVHQAIYSTLSGDATLMSLATHGVWNDVPEGTPMPHVLITRPVETPSHTLGGPTTGLGWNVLARVYTYSRYQGDLEALQIHGRIVALLNFAEIPVSGFTKSYWTYERGTGFVKDLEKLESHFMLDEFRVIARQ